jgi:hypothetical protein
MSRQDFEWLQDFKTSLITVEFVVPKGTRTDQVVILSLVSHRSVCVDVLLLLQYVEASQSKVAAGVYGSAPSVCGTLSHFIDVQKV